MIQKIIQKIPIRRAALFALALPFTTHFASACSESTTMGAFAAHWTGLDVGDGK